MKSIKIVKAFKTLEARLINVGDVKYVRFKFEDMINDVVRYQQYIVPASCNSIEYFYNMTSYYNYLYMKDEM